VNFLQLGSSFLLGALDGVSPAHGKPLIAAFAMDRRLRQRQLLAFGLAMLGSHFVLLLALALVFRGLLAENAPGPWLEWIGPVATIGFGGYLLLRRRRAVRAARAAGHEDACTCAAHEPDRIDPKRGVQQAATMGLLVGLMPCPMAISTVVLSLQAGNALMAAGIVGGYVLGMGLVLALIAAAFFWGARWFREQQARQQQSDAAHQGPWWNRAPWLRANALLGRLDSRLVAAWLVIGLGVVYLLGLYIPFGEEGHWLGSIGHAGHEH
jgi:ABC-type nickel/cobalt efflux system permease component RcnA